MQCKTERLLGGGIILLSMILSPSPNPFGEQMLQGGFGDFINYYSQGGCDTSRIPTLNLVEVSRKLRYLVNSTLELESRSIQGRFDSATFKEENMHIECSEKLSRHLHSSSTIVHNQSHCSSLRRPPKMSKINLFHGEEATPSSERK